MATETLGRLLHVLRTIQRRQFVTLSELQDSLQRNNFSHSKNTVKRDFEKLKDFGFYIKYDSKHGGYYIDNDNGGYTTDIENFLEAFELFTALDSVKGFSDFVFPMQRRPTGLSYLQPLIGSIKKSQIVQFHYHKHSNRNKGFLVTDPQHNNRIFESLNGVEESLRCVSPYVLKEFRGLWYLIGKDEKDGKIKTFGFDRISDIQATGRKFTKDTTFNIAERYRDCFGIYTPDEDSQAEDIILSFDAENGRYLKANPLHHSQKILIDTPDEFRISLHLHVTLDFLQEILTRTWSLRVISPDSLRLKVCEIYRKAQERNQ